MQGKLIEAQESGIPDDWIVTISDNEIKEIAQKMVSLAMRFPYLRSRVRELVWLICMEDKRVALKAIKEGGEDGQIC